MEFKTAVRRQAKARLGITGPSGSGKTWAALLIAAGLGGTIAVIDSEKGSASLYAGMPGMPEFSVLELGAPYSPERYIEALHAAAAAGFTTAIVDSATHEWNGIGGCLEINDTLANAKYRGNTWSAWNETTPRHRRFVDAMLSYPGHVIVTMRSKTETAQEEKNGRKTVVKLGMKAEQRDGIEYEMTTVLDIVHAGHYAMASKDRTGLFVGQDPKAVTIETGLMLKRWLDSGEEAIAAPADAPADTPVGHLSEAFITDALQAISNADTMRTLRSQYNRAHFEAEQVSDDVALEKFTSAKDARKLNLEAHHSNESQGVPA